MNGVDSANAHPTRVYMKNFRQLCVAFRGKSVSLKVEISRENLN